MLSIARLRTNAQNLDELQLGMLELEALTDDSNLQISYLPMAKQFLLEHQKRGLVDISRVMTHAAMFDDDTHSATAWRRLRDSIEDGKTDHSTHNLAPYEGKMMPKLARALINICLKRKVGARVCDPFCGSGTVLVEAALMGHYGYGYDVNPYAIHLTTKKLRGIERTPSWEVHYADFSRLNGLHSYHAVVTSPPYFNAIDYIARDWSKLNDEVLDACKIDEDRNSTLSQLGIGQTTAEYQQSIRKCCHLIAASLVGHGRCAIVIGDHENTPSSLWYEQYLRESGLRLVAKLDRPYQVVKRGFEKDVIIIAEKTD